jgi:Asp-tRNA(Asn)/Glu-tRNA(Gln) amidotransferase A subunit family amidase
LQLISASSRHSLAFLQIREARVLEAAEASTRRYQDGISKSILDGVPVAVKDEVDLDGYKKSMGSSRDFTRQGGGTSWCVQKWEEAGAVIIGKLSMHELGLGKRTRPNSNGS